MQNNHFQVSKTLFEELANSKTFSDEPYLEVYFKRYLNLSNSLAQNLNSRRAKQQKIRQTADRDIYKNFICTLLRQNQTSNDADAGAPIPNDPLPNSEDLDCPVCFELMAPPRKIVSCHNGHLLCSVCKACPRIQSCPLCRDDFKARAPRRDFTAEEKAKRLRA